MIDIINPKGEFKIINIRDNADGKFSRRTIEPDSDISSEPQEVQTACEKAWTPEVVAAYEAHKAEWL